MLTVACKDRRASCCPGCARLYERDAYHLLAAGLRGGKGIPADVGTHPAAMVTLTAPSFGAVHRNRDDGGPCRCGHRHASEDRPLGTPLDPDRYDYARQVIWNRLAPQLWRRTVQAIRRGLARRLDTPAARLSRVAHVRFAKVAEFQRRGVVHYHAIVRVDGPDGLLEPPPPRCTTALLIAVIDAAVTAVGVAIPDHLAGCLPRGAQTTTRWGAQREIVGLDPVACTGAASYIAKYATKATEAATGTTPLKPIRSTAALAHLTLDDHPRALVTTAWSIGRRAGDRALQRWAHQFGYGGHTLTKSHRYSVTFTALRAARAQWHMTGSSAATVVVRAPTHLRRPGPSRANGRPMTDLNRATTRRTGQTTSGRSPDLIARQRRRDGGSSAAPTGCGAEPSAWTGERLPALDADGSSPLQPPVGERLLTAEDVAALLRVPRSLVYALARRGELPALRVGERYVRFPQRGDRSMAGQPRGRGPAARRRMRRVASRPQERSSPTRGRGAPGTSLRRRANAPGPGIRR